MTQDNTNPGNEPSNPFRLNFNEIKSANEDDPVPPRPEPPEPQPTPQSVQPAPKPPESFEQPQQVVHSPPEESFALHIPQPQLPQVQPQLRDYAPALTASRETVAVDAELQVQQKLAFLISLPVLAAILVYAYFWSMPTLGDLFKTWTNNIDYHHGFFVAPFVAYFLWIRRDTFPTKQVPMDAVIGMILGTALLLFWCVFRYYVMVWSMVTLDSWSILVWVWAVCLMCFGIRVFVWALPSLVFLAFMFPWPPSIEGMLRGPLQEFAARLSVYILRVTGEQAIAQSNVVLMSNMQRLDVEAACSGIRVLISVIAAAYAAVLLMRRPWWQNLLLFCMVIPVALFVNAFRIAMTGLLIKHASATIDGFGFEKKTAVVCDEISGMVMLVLTFVFFVAIVWWFGKVFYRVDVTAQQTRIRHAE